ncbi:DUF2935 family protein [Natranaerovirga hydrolytica]|uniref:DUF2935 family protein n=1 Tax=Natranaerovirga hydrolytica TaxID=680378 RepID=A0A4R1MMX8_9FIRM|nr:DUF2935 domain-containing protein [Natranaerovirga hydrolytica]TCK93262.1 DUF2935 family protein [Natranaerovirga hydrolytica]
MFYSVYGDILPLRVLEEISFWKLQEKEHALLLINSFVGLEPIYVDTLEQWAIDFEETEETSNDYLRAYGQSTLEEMYTIEELTPFIKYCFDESNAFIQFLAEMINNSIIVETLRFAPILTDHVIRESKYFIDITTSIITGEDIDFVIE